MAKIKSFISNNLHWLIVAGVGLLCAGFFIAGHPNEEGYITLGGDVTISESTKQFIEEARKATIEYAKEAIPAVIINENGEEETIDVPTIEFIDGGNIDIGCPDSEECGLGAYIYAPTETFQEFKNYTLNKCWNVDGYAGAQCWDLGALHWMNYTKDGRTLSTCGKGGAKNTWECRDYNAGTEYELIYNASEIRTGDWVVFDGGTWGHIGEAAGPYNNGYVALLGQNQGSIACAGGGSATNIINISLKNFIGAFRPKTYVTPEPTPPSPEPVSDCKTWDVVEGDTMGAIMRACTGGINWSNINDYADKWVSQNIKPGQTVYQGWNSTTGVGLYAGDVIRYSE